MRDIVGKDDALCHTLCASLIQDLLYDSDVVISLPTNFDNSFADICQQ